MSGRATLLLFCMFAGSGLGAGADRSASGRCTIPLNGQWQCEPGVRDEAPGEWHHKVPVPGLVDLCEPALAWADHEYFWYRKVFRVGADQRRALAFVRIEQSQFGTEVRLNGQRLGVYNGCYTSHEYDATRAIRYGEDNVLLVKVGRKNTLPPGNAAGSDNEKRSFVPGIWGDVFLLLTGNPRISAVLVTPRLDKATAQVRVDLENRGAGGGYVRVTAVVLESESGKRASNEVGGTSPVRSNERRPVILNIPLADMHAWSPEDPFLYRVVCKVVTEGGVVDEVSQTFGMRDFRIGGSDFYLNGKRVFLKGSNLAFHRFLSDPQRRHLPWDLDWIKKVLIDIPKESHFNYFRNHLGHMYNRWYDLADEHGMLIQDEWMFWGRLMADEAVVQEEFAQWMEDNYNHPSIVIWDPLNEWQTNAEAQAEARWIAGVAVPDMKRIDPTRPWEFVDFEEEHPYLYSLGPVLNDDRFGFARSIRDMEQSRTPTVLNEFPWFWLDDNADPSFTTGEVLLRWLGPGSTAEERLDLQAFLATELVEQFRRMRVDGIAPFAYLSDNGGCTANWFLGDIAQARPKPVLAALKNAFAPFGVSVELWDRHFFPREERAIDVYVFNDDPEAREGRLTCRILREGEAVFETTQQVAAPAGGLQIIPVRWRFPDAPGRYLVRADLSAAGGPPAFSEKVAYVLEEPEAPAALRDRRVVVHETDGEIGEFLGARGLAVCGLDDMPLRTNDILVIGAGRLGDMTYLAHLEDIEAWIAEGGTMVVVEPERSVAAYLGMHLPGGMTLKVRKRENTGRGGYDSYVFPEDPDDPLWSGIDAEHLKMLNGGYGGVMVRDCDVLVDRPFFIRARSGLSLRNAAVMETGLGQGAIVISRIVVSGRLMPGYGGPGLYGLRPDPVAQRYLLNLLAAAAGSSRATPRLADLLQADRVAASSEDEEYPARYAADGDGGTRWSSDASDPQWVFMDLGKRRRLAGVKLSWEAAYATGYAILVSVDGKVWQTVAHEMAGDGGDDEVTFPPADVRYVGLVGLARGTGWGYSLWEMRVLEAEADEVPAR